MKVIDRTTARILSPLDVADSFDDHLKVAVVVKETKHKDKKGNEYIHKSKRLVLTAYSMTKNTAGETVYGPPSASYQVYTFFTKFATRTRRKARNYEEKFEVPFTDLSVAVIENCWPRRLNDNSVYKPTVEKGSTLDPQGSKINFTFADIKSQFLYDAKIEAEKIQDANARRYAAYKATGEIDFWATVVTNPLLPPAPHQKAAAINSLKANVALWMEQGTGKTLVPILKMETEASKRTDFDVNPYRVLILCPKNVRENWRREINKFSTLPHRATVVRGAKATDRVAEVVTGVMALPSNNCEDQHKHVSVIMGYESYVRTEQYLRNIEWDLVVIDEGHSIANPSTSRTQALLRLRQNSKSRLILTGTPYKNSIIDLFPQMEFLYEGASGATSLKEYRELHTESEKLASGVTVLTGLKNIPMLQERISRNAFLITKQEAMPNLPKKTFDIIECAMSHEQAKVYRQVASQLYAQMEDTLTGETNSLTVNNVLTQLLRLAQITSGYVVWDAEIDENGELVKDQAIDTFDSDPVDGQATGNSSMKMDTLLQLIRDKKPWEKTQIWCCFTHNIKKIAALLTAEGIDCVTYYGATSDKDRQIAEDRFNNDTTCKVFIGHPRAGGTGLNLLGYNRDNPESTTIETKEYDSEGTLQLVRKDTNCDHVVYYSYNWSYVDRSQSQDRAHRRGTRVPVRVSALVVPGSIDSEIEARLELKQSVGMSITDVRTLLKSMIDTNPSENGD